MFQHFCGVLFSHFSPRRPEQHLADFLSIFYHFEAFSAGFWGGVESVIFDDTTVYNRYFEGPGGCDLASFGHCFSRGLPGAPFLWFLDVFGVRRDPVLKLPGAPWGTFF